MSLAKLNELLAHPAPGFICEGAGETGAKKFLAKITHEALGPASASDLSKLEAMIPSGAEQLLAFYKIHDGVILYKDTVDDAEGVELFAVENMEEGTNELREWLDTIEEEDDGNKLKSAIAIGQVPHSGNYFAMPVEGLGVGKVFYVDHDDWSEEPFANSFDEFVDRITTSPAKLLAEDLGCYARYSDGKTEIQWIPEEYFPDVSKARV
jgi:hypothetical protein